MPRLLGDFNNDGVVNGSDAAAELAFIKQRAMNTTIDPPVTNEDIDAGNMMRNGKLTILDATSLQAYYAKKSVNARIYPDSQPSNWTDSGADGYKKYFYINGEGEEVSLAEEATAPTWESKYYYYSNEWSGSQLGDDPLAALVTHLP